MEAIRSLAIRRCLAWMINLGIVSICALLMAVPITLFGSSRELVAQFFAFVLVLGVPLVASLFIGRGETDFAASRGEVAMELQRVTTDGAPLPAAIRRRWARFRSIAVLVHCLFILTFIACGVVVFNAYGFASAKRLLIRWTTGVGVGVILVQAALLVARHRLAKTHHLRVGELLPAPTATALAFTPPSAAEFWGFAREAHEPEAAGPAYHDHTPQEFAPSRTRRFWSGVLDVLFLVSAASWLALLPELLDDLLRYRVSPRFNRFLDDLTVGLPLLFAAAALTVEAITGRSFGKQLTGLIVRRPDALAATPAVLAARLFIRYAIPLLMVGFSLLPWEYQSIIPFSVRGYFGLLILLWIFLMLVAVVMPRGKGWYDAILGTRVFRREVQDADLRVQAFEVQMNPPRIAQPVAPREEPSERD